LIQLLANAEFDIRKEAAWAISNATSGGSPAQIKFLVQQGCIRPLCDLLTVNDAKIVTIALEGLENVSIISLLLSSFAIVCRKTHFFQSCFLYFTIDPQGGRRRQQNHWQPQ
jgi:hypothetical protein